MPTMKESLYFNYNGISCRTHNLMNVNLDGGMFEEAFHASRSIIETKVRGSDTPLYSGIEEEPLEFQMTIAFTKTFTDADIDNIILWLFQDTYKPLYFEDKPNKIYYCMPNGDSQIAHTGLREGYITISMRCKSSRVYSPKQTSTLYDLSTNSGRYVINIDNKGHVPIFPEISITKVGLGNITILINGKIFEIRNLKDREQVYINCEKEIITTDMVGMYLYDSVIGDFHDIEFKCGNNTFQVEGKCKIQFRYVFKYKF